MKQTRKTSISLTDDELGILDAVAKRKGVTRSEVLRHLILYQGLVGGDFPLTTKILSLRDTDRERVVSEIRAKCESDDPPKPQAFRQWVKDILGKADAAALDRSGDALLQGLLDSQPEG